MLHPVCTKIILPSVFLIYLLSPTNAVDFASGIQQVLVNLLPQFKNSRSQPALVLGRPERLAVVSHRTIPGIFEFRDASQVLVQGSASLVAGSCSCNTLVAMYVFVKFKALLKVFSSINDVYLSIE